MLLSPHHRYRLRSMIGVAAALLLFGCSNQATEESAASDEEGDVEEDSSTDEPAWINGSYLTCSWDRIESSSEVGVGCQLDEEDFAGLDTSNLTYTWVVKDKDGKNAEISRSSLSEDSKENIIVMIASLIAGSIVHVEISDGTTTSLVEASFDELEGMGKDSKLAACFNTEDMHVKGCFDAAGVVIQLGDAIQADTSTKVSAACAESNTDRPADVMCELKTDAIMGGIALTWDWFVKGENLIADDGTIKSSNFCDANGIKAKHTLAPIDEKPRWYPYWDLGSRPCYREHRTTGYDSKPFFHPQVLANPEDGVNGEPFCYFLLVDHPLILENYGLPRLHIIKNPKVFPDAVNDSGSFNLSKLQATASYFACQEDD